MEEDAKKSAAVRPGPAAGSGRIEHADPRPALGLDELLERLVGESLLNDQNAREIESRATTLKR